MTEENKKNWSEDYRNLRADHRGAHKTEYLKNRDKIMKTQNLCGICGRPVDFSVKIPSPMAPSVDHIIPINKGGHPSAMENLQLTHWACNREKSDKIYKNPEEKKVIGNRNLPQSRDWKKYRGE